MLACEACALRRPPKLADNVKLVVLVLMYQDDTAHALIMRLCDS